MSTKTAAVTLVAEAMDIAADASYARVRVIDSTGEEIERLHYLPYDDEAAAQAAIETAVDSAGYQVVSPWSELTGLQVGVTATAVRQQD